MNRTNYNNLKLTVKMTFLFITFVIFVISAFPITVFYSFLSEYLNITPDSALKTQENSTEFIVYMLVFSVFSVCLSTVLVTWLIAKICGYNKQQCIDYFYRYENLPKHWLKR
jgi:VIT1/CCC1 family predicted Fe2+/Mn2+ transporter